MHKSWASLIAYVIAVVNLISSNRSPSLELQQNSVFRIFKLLYLVFLPSTSSINWCLCPDCIQILCQCQAHWKNLSDNSCKLLPRQGILTSWWCGGEIKRANITVLQSNSHALPLFSPVSGRQRNVAQCVSQFYIVVTEENAVCRFTGVQTHCCRHICSGKLLVSFCTACLNLWLKRMAWSIANSGSLSTANSELWSRSCNTEVPWEHKFNSMGAADNCCGCLSLHGFAFVVSCRMWKESVSSWV